MDVKFANCDVPIWKLKKGVVVSYEILDHTSYGHIEAIYTVKDSCPLLVISLGSSRVTVKPEKLTWLEPF
jgi:hypothetical protein